MGPKPKRGTTPTLLTGGSTNSRPESGLRSARSERSGSTVVLLDPETEEAQDPFLGNTSDSPLMPALTTGGGSGRVGRRASNSSRPGSSPAAKGRRSRPDSVKSNTSSVGSSDGKKPPHVSRKSSTGVGGRRSSRTNLTAVSPGRDSKGPQPLSPNQNSQEGTAESCDRSPVVEDPPSSNDRKRGGSPTIVPFCTQHPTEVLHIYCVTCKQAVCDVCFNLYHTSGTKRLSASTTSASTISSNQAEVNGAEGKDGVFFEGPKVRHEWKFLGDVTAASRRMLNPILNHTGQIHNDLHKLIEEIPSKEQHLHRYVDEQTNAIESALETKRRELHQDASSRAAQMELVIREEMRRCQEELDILDEGQSVLRALSVGEGVVGDGRLGQLILGHLDYQDFHDEVHRPLHEAETMLSYQGLQLPVQDLQSMCSLVDWTPLSVSNAPQLFP